MEVLEKAENVMIKDNNTDGLVSVFKTKFEYLAELKDFMRAEITAFLAVDLIQKIGDIKEEAQMYLKLSEMYKNNNDEKAALEYMMKANKLLEQI
ncbi:hypothetical protein Q428_08415 [Fervidicella metallireducens AeB]|uniref:Tetratricopeptide repeat protein n=1 Tax=Fervidicella metallireducens AeB TaxID=1403537 RepID=A0A017RUM1_9CLOT|nr:hypothetical protein Q428_08415 [Fervidicella metallireducens AeB]